HHPFCGSIGHGFCRRVFQFRGAAYFAPPLKLYAEPLADRPFGALRDCSAARNNFSKFPAPASRFASPTAPSAARASYPRFTSAEMTSTSIPAGEDAAGLSASTATASSLSFNSTTMRSAVLQPTPRILVNRPRSLP